MQQNNVNSWEWDDSLDAMLFFAQRLNELLFHHTTDTYRFSAISLIGLAKEYCSVYRASRKGIINEKNLKHIIDELDHRLQKDDIAKQILTEEFVARFHKGHGSWTAKEQHENITYMGRKLSNGIYYDALVSQLVKLIKENGSKKEVDKLTTVWAREIIDGGYNENFVYITLKEIFFQAPVSSTDTIDAFFAMFDFEKRNYDVYVGFQSDIMSLKNLLSKVQLRNSKIIALNPQEAPVGIKKKNQRTILKFETIQSYDMYTACEIANDVVCCVADSYNFFRHEPRKNKTHVQVISESGVVTTIRPHNLLKHRVAALSIESSEQRADELLHAQFSTTQNRKDFSKISKIHNAAIYSDNVNDSLLSLWSMIESFIEDDEPEIKKQSEDTEEQKGKVVETSKVSRSKTGKVIAYIIPFLKSTYISKLVQTCMDDIQHWNVDFFNENISTIEFGNNDLERTFAFLSFDTMNEKRVALYQQADKYPLLKNRVFTLNEAFHNSKNIKALIQEHAQRVEWHIYRIYRARNYIVHDAEGNEKLNSELLINLHSYVDVIISKIVQMINDSPYHDNIRDILSEHKFEVSIFDEKIEKQSKEDISSENGLKYLYYDFKL